MALLSQTPVGAQDNTTRQQGQAGGEEQQEAMTPDQSDQSQGLSFTPEQLADSFRKNMNDKQAEDMGRVIEEGKQFLFGEQDHDKLMSMLQGSQDVGQDLGQGAVGAMNLVLQAMAKEKPGEAVNGDSILPAGLVLIALVLDFVNESGMAPVNDNTFEKASHIFSTKMMSTYSPQFKERAAQYQTQPQQPIAPQTANAPAGGM